MISKKLFKTTVISLILNHVLLDVMKLPTEYCDKPYLSVFDKENRMNLIGVCYIVWSEAFRKRHIRKFANSAFSIVRRRLLLLSGNVERFD